MDSMLDPDLQQESSDSYICQLRSNSCHLCQQIFVYYIVGPFFHTTLGWEDSSNDFKNPMNMKHSNYAEMSSSHSPV